MPPPEIRTAPEPDDEGDAVADESLDEALQPRAPAHTEP
jgi:hypothetical protein